MASVRVRFLGSGDAFGSGGRFQTSILLETDGYRCLVDCGASSLTALKQAAVDPSTIDAVHMSADLLARVAEMPVEAAQDGYEVLL